MAHHSQILREWEQSSRLTGAQRFLQDWSESSCREVGWDIGKECKDGCGSLE